MAYFISIGLFLILVSAISYYGYRRYARPGRVYEQLGGTTTYTMPAMDQISEQEPGLVVTIFEQIGEKVPISLEDASLLRRDLLAAGFRSEKALPVYLAARILGTVFLVIIALLVRDYITTQPVLLIVIPAGAGLLGFFGPSIWLDGAISKRHEKIREGLPDALDLMVVSVEAGLGLDQAIQYVSRELMQSHPEICQELHAMTLEIRAGARRIDALRHLADRSGEPELRKLVAILIQTDRFGTSIADSLRTHSDFMRVRRRQEAEERANKVGVKLVFPIFFLMLPSMVVVAAGPGLLQVFKYLFPMLRNSTL